MLGKLDLILLLELYVVLDKLKRPIPIFFISLLILFAVFGLEKQGQLTNLGLIVKFFVLVQKNLLEIGTIFVCRGNIRADFVKTRSSYQGFDLVKEFLNLHVARKARVNFYGRFEVGFVGFPSKDDLKHRIEDHL